MKYIKPINEFWGDVLKRDLLGETREEDKFHSMQELKKYLKSEIEKQGENVVIKDLDVSPIEDLSYLFNNIITDDVKTLDLSGWKTSNVKNMSKMFYCCDSLKSLDLSGWDTSSVEIMNGMFYKCCKLKSLDLSGWKTSNIKDMSWMFYNCCKLKSLDLSDWDTSNVEDMSAMFSHCSNLKSLDLSGWDTSKISDMYGMLYNCPAPYKVIDNKIVKK